MIDGVYPCAVADPRQYAVGGKSDLMTDSIPAKGTVLAFDFGKRRIGVAVGELETDTAHAIAVIEVKGEMQRDDAIERLIREWRPVLLVVGEPTRADGSTHQLSPAVRRFRATLANRFSLPVHGADEQYTSVTAESDLRDSGIALAQRKELIDAHAARLILESFLHGRHG